MISRKYTKKILDLVNEGIINKDNLINEFLNWIPENDVQRFFEDCDYIFIDESELDDNPDLRVK